MKEKNKVFVVNSTEDDYKYVAEDRQIAERVRDKLFENRAHSNEDYFITTAQMVFDESQMSKYDLLDADKEDGDELVYFFDESGNWFRTYMNPERAPDTMEMIPDAVSWEVRNHE